MELRYYQRDAVDTVYRYLRNNPGKNPICVIPTGGGKTPVMAAMCRDVARCGGRVIVLSHVKELVEQTAATLAAVDPNLDVGVYSAGLGSRDAENDIVCAGIQSVYQRADALGAFRLILVDECHLIPPDGDGMYQTYLRAARTIEPSARLVGLTATPYRLKSGSLTGDGKLFDDICYEISVRELIDRGYLSKLKSKCPTSCTVDTSELHVKAGEYVASEMADIYDDSTISKVVGEIRDKASSRKKILVFAPTKEIARNFAERWHKRTGETPGLVFGDTPADERAELIKRFKGETVPANLFGEEKPELRMLVNVNVLTTGFDAPNVDCVVLLRPTKSPGLYYQMVGRGFRTTPDKTDCLVLDFGNNIARHGPVDAIIPPAQRDRENAKKKPTVKQCMNCGEMVPVARATCPDCGHVFEPQKTRVLIEGKPADRDIVSDGQPVVTTMQVLGTEYFLHIKKDAAPDTPRTMRVEYKTLHGIIREWQCPEHSGFARERFENWWSVHVAPQFMTQLPETAEEAVMWAKCLCADTLSITTKTKQGERFPTVVDYTLAPPPTIEESQRRWNEMTEAWNQEENF